MLTSRSAIPPGSVARADRTRAVAQAIRGVLVVDWDWIGVWEAANRDDLFSVTSLKHFPYVANSDFHRPKHLYSWKTLVRSRKDWPSLKSALRDNVNLAITLYRGESWTAARARA